MKRWKALVLLGTLCLGLLLPWQAVAQEDLPDSWQRRAVQPG